MSQDPVTAPTHVTSASEWKKSAGAPVPLEVPSGNVCLAKKPGMQAFVKAGLIPNSLLPMVMKAIRKQATPDFQKEVEQDGEKIQDMIRLMDNVVVFCLVDPRVYPIPPEEDPGSSQYDPEFERDEERLYVDDVDPEDKAFVFQWAAGGTADLERFRHEARELMAASSAGEDVQRPAKRAAKPRKR